MKKLIVISLLLCQSVFAATEIQKSQIDFTAIGNPSFIKATGKLLFSKAELKQENDKVSGTIIVDLDKLDTEIELRDEHLKENYLETKKFPEAKLVLKPFEIKSGESLNKKVMATLELHGEKKDMEIELEVTRDKQLISVEGEFSIKLSDHKIELPSFQGITAADTVKLKVAATLKI
jgi:polyisoprenoid-binding protein YceI